MIQLTHKQLEALQSHSDAKLLSALQDYLRTHHTEAVATLSGQSLPELSQHGLNVSRRLGLDDPVAIFWVAAMMLEVGILFYQQTSIYGYLTDRQRSPQDRVRAVLNYVTADEWQQAGAIAQDGSME